MKRFPKLNKADILKKSMTNETINRLKNDDRFFVEYTGFANDIFAEVFNEELAESLDTTFVYLATVFIVGKVGVKVTASDEEITELANQLQSRYMKAYISIMNSDNPLVD